MARPAVLTKTLAAANAAIIAASQIPVSGTPLTLVGGGPVILDTPRRVLLTFGNEAANRTMVISGTMEGGQPISETVAVASGAGGTVPTLQDFATVTSALPLGGGWTAAVTLGTNTVGSTRWYVPNYDQQVQNLGATVLLVSGAATWQVETTMQDPRAPIYPIGPTPTMPIPTPFIETTLGTTNTPVSITKPILGIRLTILTGTGVVQLELVPAGIRD